MLQSLRKDPMDEDLEKCDGDYFPCEFCGDPYPVEFIMRHQVSIQGVSTQTFIFHFALAGRNMQASLGWKVI